jgi:hypothetical protein
MRFFANIVFCLFIIAFMAISGGAIIGFKYYFPGSDATQRERDRARELMAHEKVEDLNGRVKIGALLGGALGVFCSIVFMVNTLKVKDRD